ncbi:MAG: sigma-54 dependent transcriptional regulator [Myxococcota bacterium]|nr:sigma-54 dependent transcriptional regulator [Myxococcota bacterium]
MSATGVDGQSPSIMALRDAIERLAPTGMTLLVNGESGTGKERVARAVHAASTRAGGPFVAVDCAALPVGLAKAELFGHVRGAFTGATRARDGVVQAAQGGTLFLDEVGDLPGPTQAALLRTLADGTVQRVGAVARQRVDIRVIAATSRDLVAEVEAGRFRADLRFRLAAARIDVPPLRNRGKDVLLLASMLLEEACVEVGRPRRILGPSARAVIQSSPWPGNVRELRNAMRRAAVFAEGESVEAADLGCGTASASLQTLAEARAAAERRYLETVLRATDGNVSAAARKAGIHRTELHRLMRRHGLRGDDFRPF